MKHSHDKKDEYEEDDARDSMDRGSIGGYIKIGRKDIRPLYDEDRLQNEASEEEFTEVENNHEEDRSLDTDVEEENEASRYEDVVEKFDTEVDHEEDEVSDEARDAGSDTETSNDGNGRKQENSDKSNNHEADDGSSAVSHVNFIRTANKEKEVVGISDQHQKNTMDLENKDTNSDEAKNGETSNEDNPSSSLSVTTNSLDKGLSQNNTLTEAPKSNLEASNSTTDVTPQNPELFEQSVTKSVPELDHDQGIVSEAKSMVGSIFKIISLQQNSSTSTVENQTEPRNSSEGDFEDFLKPYNDADSLPIVRMSRSEHSFEDEANSRKNETVSRTSDSAAA